MDSTGVDLFSVTFWCTVLVAILVLVPLQRAAARKWALACINVAFLALLLGRWTPVAVAGLLVAWLFLRLAHSPFGRLAVAVGGTAVLTLFVIHKLPGTGPAGARAILAAVGFSYVALRWVDAARAVAEGRRPPPDPIATINYLVPFHMLAAGPIESFDEFCDQPPVPPPPSVSDALEGGERIASGLFKKFVLAYAIETVFLTGFRARGPYLLLEVQFNYLWIYLDFSGYSDIAVGVGRLIGVATPENFNRPYLARNVIDYWDRWHISLSQFVRRNVFIPLQVALMRRTGGSRACWSRRSPSRSPSCWWACGTG